jgi:hypothetical protein
MFGVQIDQALTDKMVERAVEACAEEHFAGDARRMRRALLQGQCEHCSCLSGSLVHQIADYLGQVDRTVKAIYEYRPSFDDDLLSPFDQDRGALKEHTGINLVAWVERKSAALSALVESLEKALTLSQLKIGCVKAAPSCFTLDVQMVDDRDINERRGFGLLVEAPAIRVRQIWERTTPVQPPGSEPQAIPGLVGFSLPDAFDPELIPESRLIDHAFAIERIPVEDRSALEHHLMDLKVTLIRRMISEHLAYIDIAKRWFTIRDLDNIYQRRIGFGKIGGKAAGMLLAARILNEAADDEIRTSLSVPESFFLGSDLIYIFMSMNGLMYWNDQKYKSEEQIRAEYPQIQEEFQKGSFPPEILAEFRELLENIGSQPLIVRSSSQLEDNFGTSFAGKYDSFFLANQGTPEENLTAFTNAIARTYASTLKPEALLYRRSKNLQDYDERMAVLIQAVQGEQFGHYYLPHGSGVAFSHNIFRWSPQIRREDGFARLVWGLGTRAVQRLGDDYPRLVALSHPNLLPDDSPDAIRHYSQQRVDLIDLQENSLKTLPIHEVLTPGYPPLRLIAQLEQDGFFVSPRMRVKASDLPRLAINYQDFLKRSNFAPMLTKILRLLEIHFHTSVDMEFTINLPDPNAAKPPVHLTLLQCRPQSYLAESLPVHPPQDLTEEDIIFSTRFMVPRGHLKNLRYVLFVTPEGYLSLPSNELRAQVSQAISQLNNLLGEKTFVCVGPGRWGSTNLDLGVYVSYADIHHAAALVEVTGRGIGPAPEPSLGTHFFQDLMEARIYPLALSLDDENVRFNRGFFYQAPNAIHQFIRVDRPIAECVRLIDIKAYHPGHHLELIMDDERGEALAYFVVDDLPEQQQGTATEF